MGCEVRLSPMPRGYPGDCTARSRRPGTTRTETGGASSTDRCLQASSLGAAMWDLLAKHQPEGMAGCGVLEVRCCSLVGSVSSGILVLMRVGAARESADLTGRYPDESCVAPCWRPQLLRWYSTAEQVSIWAQIRIGALALLNHYRYGAARGYRFFHVDHDSRNKPRGSYILSFQLINSLRDRGAYVLGGCRGTSERFDDSCGEIVRSSECGLHHSYA